MTGSDHIRTISRIKNVAKINVPYGDLSARIYYLMLRFPVVVSITQCVTFQWYKVTYTKYIRPARLRGRVWLRQTSLFYETWHIRNSTDLDSYMQWLIINCASFVIIISLAETELRKLNQERTRGSLQCSLIPSRSGIREWGWVQATTYRTR